VLERYGTDIWTKGRIVGNHRKFKELKRLKEKTKSVEPSPRPSDEDEDAKRSRIRFALDTLPGVIKETCKVYREMRADQLDHMKGRSLVWVLSMLRQLSRRKRLNGLSSDWKKSRPQSKASPMVTRTQIDRLAQRIEMLGRVREDGPRIGVIWRECNETATEARDRHARLYPEDDVANMRVIGWKPMTEDEWAKKYSVPNPPKAGWGK
jgi:hypothetical protein